MRITASGAVGINTTAPSSTLHVGGDIQSTGKIYAQGTPVSYTTFWGTNSVNQGGVYMPYGYLGTNGSYRSSWMWNGFRNAGGTWTSLNTFGYPNAAGIELGYDGISFRADETTPTGTEPTLRMKLLANGNLGIGTATPSATLHVVSDTTQQIRIGTGAANSQGYLGTDINGFTRLGGQNGVALNYGPPATPKEALRVQHSTGFIGISTSTPSTTLHVAGTIRMAADPAQSCDANRLGAIKYESNNFLVCRNGTTWETLVAGASGTATTSFVSLTDVSASLAFNNLFGPGSTTGARSGVVFSTAFGVNSLAGASNSGGYNTAFGSGVLASNTSGLNNSGFGLDALGQNTTGEHNVGVGSAALEYNTTGSLNTAVGLQAGSGVSGQSAFSHNSLFGAYSGGGLTTGSNNLLLGFNVGAGITTGSNNILLGYNISPYSNTGSNQLNIANTIWGSIGSGMGHANRIGINVTSPSQALEVSGTISGTTVTTGILNLRSIAGSAGVSLTAAGDNLGNHTATQALDMATFNITNAGTINGTFVGDGSGLTNLNVQGDRITSSTTAGVIANQSGGTVSFTLGGTPGAAYLHPSLGFVGPGVSITGIISGTTVNTGILVLRGGTGSAGVSLTAPGDNLGNHTATQALDMATFNITNAGTINGTFVGDGSGLTNLNVQGDRITSGTSYVQANPDNTISISGTTYIGKNTATGAGLEIGGGATGNRNSYIDLTGDTTYTDFGLRIIRNSTGANATSDIIQRGTGALTLRTSESAPIALFTNSLERFRVSSNGNIGISTTNPNAKLEIVGRTSTTTVQLSNNPADACTAADYGTMKMVNGRPYVCRP